MWFSFGILTLIASTLWGFRLRLASRWSGMPEWIGSSMFCVQERLNEDRLIFVRLGTSAPAGLNFRVRSEGLHDRFFKWLGVSTEIQTRDPLFDRKLYVESDARAVAILLKRNAQLRSRLIKIFTYAERRRLGRMCVRCSNQRIWVEFRPKDDYEAYDAKQHLGYLLSTISASLECVDVPTEYRRDRFVWRAAAALAFSTGTLALGAFGITRSIVGRTDIVEPLLLLTACLIPALLMTAAVTVILLALLAASSRAHTVILECALVGGLGLLLGTYALAREANMEFDSRPATAVVSKIHLEHRVRKGRRGSTYHDYYVYCRDWRPGKAGTLRLEIYSDTYVLLRRKPSATIHVKPGLFGFDWVEKIEPVL